MTTQRLVRVRRFLDCARVLKDPAHPLRQVALTALPADTGLSPENVAWALDNALEVDASNTELELLCARTPTCERAHVLLSANVFVGALRAIAIGLAAAPRVFVRPSRREPLMVDLLAQAAPRQFEVVETLAPIAGDHCWAYGSDATLAELQRKWPKEILFHGHGNGFGVVVLEPGDLQSIVSIEALAAALALDTAAFDQQGCLSPRVILVEKNPDQTALLGQALAQALMQREREIPMGTLTPEERGDVRRFRDMMCIAGRALPAGNGLVTMETDPLPWTLPPAGRVLHVRTVADAVADLRPLAHAVTTVAVNPTNSNAAARLARAFPSARITSVGRMQRPALDGPVDLRGLSAEHS
jgi:hypothetical protein